MRVDDFDFDLPEDRIALTAAEPRDAARLLHVDKDQPKDYTVRDLPALLRPGDILVANDTKVIPAQLNGVRKARGEEAVGGADVAVEATLHREIEPWRWRAFLRPAKRVRVGDALEFGPMRATATWRDGAEGELLFERTHDDFDSALDAAGAPPLPPYIARRRALTPADRDRYQTVYARHSGSVAAPTAGLHFTDDLLRRLREGGVRFASVTLHVGAGTFLPVSAQDTDDHKMHAEWGEVSADAADAVNEARAAGGRVVAIGTTSLRLLESATDESGAVRPFRGETDIFITPGYRFRAVDASMTNFHLPRSTLFMLVCAFSGTQRMKNAYAHAIERGYRFYSYGDACLLERGDG